MTFRTSTKDSKKYLDGKEALVKTVFSLETDDLLEDLANAEYTASQIQEFTWYGYSVQVLQKGRDGKLAELKATLDKLSLPVVIEENVPVTRPDKISEEDKAKLEMLKGMSKADILALLALKK